MLHNNSQGVHAYNGATASNYFLNRHLNPMANYADAGSSVTFDGGPVFGGNYQPGGKVLTDAYPYTNEQLGRTPSIGVTLPVAGTFASIGSRKTIEWRSTACTLRRYLLQVGRHRTAADCLELSGCRCISMDRAGSRRGRGLHNRD